MACRGCGVRYARVDGAGIRARPPEGEEIVRRPAEWVDRLPDPASLLNATPADRDRGEEGEGEQPEGTRVRGARVVASFVVGHEVVRDEGQYLNRIEIYGDEAGGTLELWHDQAAFRAAPPEPAVLWRFDDLTAVQASSRTLQLKARGRPLASFSFVDDSSFLWERLLKAALDRHYQRTGQGEILETQPRICVR